MSLRYLSMKQLSEVTGVDRLTVKKRLAPIKPVRKEGVAIIYDAHEALPLLYITDKKERSSLLLDEQLRYEKARAKKLELENQEKLGEIVETKEVAKVVAAEYANVRARLLSIPSRCAKDLSLESNPALVKDRLDEEVAEALSELVADAEKFLETQNAQSTEDIIEDDASEEPEAPVQTKRR